VEGSKTCNFLQNQIKSSDQALYRETGWSISPITIGRIQELIDGAPAHDYEAEFAFAIGKCGKTFLRTDDRNTSHI